MSFVAGLDVKCEACQRFFRDGLTISFTKILTDEAVSGWKFEIHVSLHSCFSRVWYSGVKFVQIKQLTHKTFKTVLVGLYERKSGGCM